MSLGKDFVEENEGLLELNMRLIDADAFKEYMRESVEENADIIPKRLVDTVLDIMEGFMLDIDEQPTIDAEQVVRCKECKHSIDYYNDGDCYCRHPNYNGETLLYIKDGYGHYCSFGERKK